jgi:hypothetical protein
LNEGRLWTGIGARVVIVDNLGVRAGHHDVVLRLGGLSGLGGTWSLLARQVGFGETLLASLLLPVVVPNAASVLNHPTSKLAEHGPGGDDSNLSRSVGEWQNLLLDEVILFGLASDNLIQRPVLVEEEIGVSVT